jgi:hypothetical protein
MILLNHWKPIKPMVSGRIHLGFNQLFKWISKDLPDPALKILAHTIGQLIPLYTTTKSRILLSTLLEEVIRKYRERIVKLIINVFDVQSRTICKVHPQYVEWRFCLFLKGCFFWFVYSRNARFQADYGFFYMSRIVIISNGITVEEETEKLIVGYR